MITNTVYSIIDKTCYNISIGVVGIFRMQPKLSPLPIGDPGRAVKKLRFVCTIQLLYTCIYNNLNTITGFQMALISSTVGTNFLDLIQLFKGKGPKHGYIPWVFLKDQCNVYRIDDFVK